MRICPKCDKNPVTANGGYCKLCYATLAKERRDAGKVRKESREVMLWRSAKHRAQQKGLDFDITPDDIVIPEYCPLLGVGLTQGDECGIRDFSPSLDRINPHKGYTKDNVWVISYRANTIKSSAHPKEIMLLAENLLKKYEG